MHFSINAGLHRDMVTLIPAGELDVATVEQLGSLFDELIEAGFGPIVIDLLRLRFIDSVAARATRARQALPGGVCAAIGCC